MKLRPDLCQCGSGLDRKACIGERHLRPPVKIPNSRSSRFEAIRTGRFAASEGDRLVVGRGRLGLIDRPGLYEAHDLGDLGGSLLLVSGFKDGIIGPTVGTAIMIAPGVAVTATHVLDELLSSGWNVDALGPGGGRALTWWRATGFSRMQFADKETLEIQGLSDLAVMTLELAGDPGRAVVLPIPIVSLQPPDVGDPVMVVGYQSDGGVPERVGLQMSRGTVTARYLSGRDRVMLPNPCLEVELEIWGGMSGGAVIDRHGELIGVASSSVQDVGKVAFVSLLTRLEDYDVKVQWPPEWYEVKHLTIGKVLETLESRAPAPPRTKKGPPTARVVPKTCSKRKHKVRRLAP